MDAGWGRRPDLAILPLTSSEAAIIPGWKTAIILMVSLSVVVRDESYCNNGGLF